MQEYRVPGLHRASSPLGKIRWGRGNYKHTGKSASAYFWQERQMEGEVGEDKAHVVRAISVLTVLQMQMSHFQFWNQCSVVTLWALV